MCHAQKKKKKKKKTYLLVVLSIWENKRMIIHFLSIPTLSQPFSTVSSLFRMYSSIPCGQALLSAGRFFCGTKEEVIIIAKNIAMYLKLNLNGHIISTRRLHSLWFLLFFNGHLPLFQWLVVIVPRFGNSIVFWAMFSESWKRFRNRRWPFSGECFSYAESSNVPLLSRANR